MDAISVRQPEAWLIVNGYKDVENRSIPTRKRGHVAILASSRRMTRNDWSWLRGLCEDNGVLAHEESEILYGGVIGVVRIVDCVADHSSPWFEGDYGYVLADAIPFTAEEFLPWGGKLGWFDVPVDMVDEE